MISKNFIKKQPKIYFYYKDILNYIKKQKPIIFDLQNNSKTIYKQLIQNKYNNYLFIGQSIWNQYLTQNPWNQLWKNVFYIVDQKTTTYFISCYIIQQEPIVKYTDRLTKNTSNLQNVNYVKKLKI